jgi:hypothetical protein
MLQESLETLLPCVLEDWELEPGRTLSTKHVGNTRLLIHGILLGSILKISGSKLPGLVQ